MCACLDFGRIAESTGSELNMNGCPSIKIEGAESYDSTAVDIGDYPNESGDDDCVEEEVNGETETTDDSDEYQVDRSENNDWFDNTEQVTLVGQNNLDIQTQSKHTSDKQLTD